MAQQADIVIYGTAVSGLVTLIPDGNEKTKDGMVSRWIENSATKGVNARISHVQKRVKMSSGVYRITSRTEVPRVEIVNGSTPAGYTPAERVAFVDTYETVSLFHERSSPAQRNDARTIHNHIQQNVATDTALATAGPAYELQVLNVMPS